MPPVRSDLEAAYRRTQYRVRTPGGDCVLRIGQYDRQAEARLQATLPFCRGWTLLTPCNPGSRRLTAARNAAACRALEASLRADGLRWLPALHRDPEGRWPDEAGYWLADPPPGWAEAQGRRWGQNALVCAAPGDAPQLVWLAGPGDDPPA
jgi:hypothetical protein